jgi:3-oxoacyl-[acyl-carrier protein] reductase
MADRRLAVVTGAARGIGRAIVLKLLEQDRIVAGLDINSEQLAELEDVVKEAGFEVITKCVDITDTAKLTQTLESLASEHGGIGVLVNNAGITRDKLMMQMKEDDFDKVIHVNNGCIAVYGKKQIRQDCEHKFGCRSDGPGGFEQLCGEQGRAYWYDKVYRPRSG